MKDYEGGAIAKGETAGHCPSCDFEGDINQFVYGYGNELDRLYQFVCPECEFTEVFSLRKDSPSYVNSERDYKWLPLRQKLIKKIREMDETINDPINGDDYYESLYSGLDINELQEELKKFGDKND